MEGLEGVISALQEALQAFSAIGQPCQGISTRLKAQLAGALDLPAAGGAGGGTLAGAGRGSVPAAGDGRFDSASSQAATVRSLMVQLGTALAALSPALKGALAAESPAAVASAAAEQLSEGLSCIAACTHLGLTSPMHICGLDALRFSQCWRLILQCGQAMLAPGAGCTC
ncbi:hypothetical protein ABPG75_004601 [Micractinium tetrahymenae]